MRVHRLSHTLAVAFVSSLLTLVVLAACGGGGGGASVSASQIIYRDASGQLVALGSGGFMRAAFEDTPGFDSATRILAENVILAANTNSLHSRNLQDALDNEIAPDLGRILPGTTWTVANRNGADAFYDGTTGQVTFNLDGTITYTGAIAAFGIGAAACGTPHTASYESMGRAFYLTRTQLAVTGSNLVQLLSASRNSLTLVGHGGCGASSTDRISTFTRLPTTGI